MATLITSLHIDYQPDLDIMWALRELCSNAIDGEERYRHLGTGKMVIEYSPRSSTLTIRNEGIHVPSSALLMGKSESRGDDRCIGKFGEGLPMALKILARLHVPVTIINGSEKWTPTIVRSPAYGNEPVLAIETRKLPIERDYFEVEIKSVTREMYQQFRGLYLKMDERYDPSMVVKSDTEESVLLQKHYEGCIYNKGVFVARRSDLVFGYNLNAELNRDRSMMDEYKLSDRLHELLSEACYRSESFAGVLSQMLVERDGVLETTKQSSGLVWNSALREQVQKIFVSRYGSDAIAVENEEEVEEASQLGLRGIRCSHVLREIINRMTGSLSERKRQAGRRAEVVPIESMGPVERSNFMVLVRMIMTVVPEARDLEFEACRFQSSEVRYATSHDSTLIQVAYNDLLDIQRSLLSLVTAVCDNRRLYGESNNILARMVAQLISGGGSSALALALIGEA